jgi:hypothetical protein
MSFIGAGDSGAQPAQPKVEAAPPPVLGPQGKKPGSKKQQTTFLGADATPDPASGNFGGKTLLGT